MHVLNVLGILFCSVAISSSIKHNNLKWRQKNEIWNENLQYEDVNKSKNTAMKFY